MIQSAGGISGNLLHRCARFLPTGRPEITTMITRSDLKTQHPEDQHRAVKGIAKLTGESRDAHTTSLNDDSLRNQEEPWKAEPWEDFIQGKVSHSVWLKEASSDLLSEKTYSRNVEAKTLTSQLPDSPGSFSDDGIRTMQSRPLVPGIGAFAPFII